MPRDGRGTNMTIVANVPLSVFDTPAVGNVVTASQSAAVTTDGNQFIRWHLIMTLNNMRFFSVN